MRTTISIDDALLDAAKRLALARNTTLGSVIEEAIRESILRSEARSSAILPPFSVVTFEGTGTAPGVNIDRPSELLEAEDQIRIATR